VRSIVILAFLLSVISGAGAQTRTTQGPDPDRVGLSCAQILAMSSSEWVAKFNSARGATPEATVRAVHVYGQCYDARTDRLAVSLGKSGRGPRMVARKEFTKLEEALNDFSEKALAATDPPADMVKTAEAELYKKHFRYLFYGDYVEHLSHDEIFSATSEDAGDIGKAKNHFGELLDTLPGDKLRQVHEAFAIVLNQAAFGKNMKLQIYLYAIYCVDPSSAAPLSHPPF
jgi:hypothetical protein